MTPPDVYLTTSELAAELRVDPSTVRRWADDGKITPALTTPGGHHRFQLEAALAELTPRPTDPDAASPAASAPQTGEATPSASPVPFGGVLMDTALADLQHPRRLVARMPDCGDLRVTVDGPYTYVDLADLEALVTGDEQRGDDRGLATIDAAIDWATAQNTDRAREFVSWVRDFLATVDDDVLEQAHPMPSFVDAVTVRRAAALLDADPAISIGLTTLFQHMELIGWVKRRAADADWELTATARRFDWLTIRPIIVRRRRYQQVYVTPRGLAALQLSLHGIAGPPDPDPTPAPTLFD